MGTRLCICTFFRCWTHVAFKHNKIYLLQKHINLRENSHKVISHDQNVECVSNVSRNAAPLSSSTGDGALRFVTLWFVQSQTVCCWSTVHMCVIHFGIPLPYEYIRWFIAIPIKMHRTHCEKHPHFKCWPSRQRPRLVEPSGRKAGTVWNFSCDMDLMDNQREAQTC